MTEKEIKRKDAFFIFYESDLKPDPELRAYSHEETCFHEIMEWRNAVVTYLDERRNQEFN